MSAGGKTPPIANEVIDQKALDNIRSLGSGNELLRKVLQAYLSSAPKLIEEYSQGLASGNVEQAHRAVHTLKSSSANVGAVRLSDLCKQIEAQVRAGQLDRAREQNAALRQAHDDAEHALRMQFDREAA